MTKSSLNVLIVEDDSSQGKALLEAVKRSGYNAELTGSAQQAMTLAHHMEFHLIIVDCMLPKSNGVDLVEELKPHLADNADIFLISGVFKDRAFIRDAVIKTGAKHFFAKPFNLEQVIAHAEHSLSNRVSVDEDPLLALYRGPIANLETWMEANPTFNALHLPILLRRILEAELSGQLILSHGALSSIAFHDGRVVEVKMSDAQSFFGILAVEKGYVSSTEVEAVLNIDDKAPIGQRLIHSLALSPHAVNIILQEQIALRLSQIVQDTNAEFRWLSQKTKSADCFVTEDRLNSLILEWLPSKYEEDWLRDLFMRWGAQQLVWLKKLHENVPSQIDEVHNPQSSTTPHELFEALLLGEARIGDSPTASINYHSMQQKLELALKTFSSSDLFQILGLSEKARTAEVQRAYETLTRAFVLPENDPNCPPKVAELAQQVAALLKRAHTTLSDEANRTTYLRDLQIRKSQEISDLEPSYHAAILELHHKSFKEAAKRFDNLVAKKATFKDIKSYRIWAHVKAGSPINVEEEFNQIAPEDRYSAIYMMARGYSYEARLNPQKAVEYFNNALMLNPKMEAASDALQEVSEQLSGTRNLRDAMNSFLGKKSKSKGKRSA